MSRKVTVQLPTGRGGPPRGRAVGACAAPGAPDAADSAPPAKVPRVARVLALAHHWQGLIRSGAVRDQAELARLVGVSRARVSQVMNLLWLAPDIQEAVLRGTPHEASSELDLRAVARCALWCRQGSNLTLGPRNVGLCGADSQGHSGLGVVDVSTQLRGLLPHGAGARVPTGG